MKEIIKYYGNREILAKYHEDDNGNIHGLYQRWHYNGQPEIYCHFINGNIHGLYQVWYDDGQLSREAIYINGEKTNLPIPKSRNEKILFKIKHGISL